MIIGPYKPDGTTWGCDRDVCNGNFIDGQYVYVGSSSFPYVVGCWGPGPDPKHAPTCTNNGCSSRPSGSGGFNSDGGSVTKLDDKNENSNSQEDDFAFLPKVIGSIGLFTAAISTLCF